MIAIRDIIGAKGWSQAEAAEQMGITQPRVSVLVNGRTEKFSIDKALSTAYELLTNTSHDEQETDKIQRFLQDN